MQEEDPAMRRQMRLKDEPQKGDQEDLTPEMETVSIWRPGHSMRGATALPQMMVRRVDC